MSYLGKIIYPRDVYWYPLGYRYELITEEHTVEDETGSHKSKDILVRRHDCRFRPFEEDVDNDDLFLEENSLFTDKHGNQYSYVDEEKSQPNWYRTVDFPYEEDFVRYHIHYSEEHVPNRIQKLLDNGTILDYLNNLVKRVEEAIDRQRVLLIDSYEKELTAVAHTDPKAYDGIINMCDLQASQIVFDSMVYC